MKRHLILLIVAVMLLGSSTQASLAAQKIVMGEVTKTSYQWPLWAGIEVGLFKEAGVDIDEQFFTKPPEAVQALSANATNMSYTVPVDGAGIAVSKGAKIVIVAGGQHKLTYDLIAGAKYANVKALKGTTLGVSSLKSGSTVILHAVMRGNGLKYPGDYKLLELGGTPKRFAAVKTGGVSAAMVAQPISFKAEDDGLKILDASANHIPLYAFTSIAANTTWAKKNRAAVVAFLRGNAKALRWLNDEKNRPQAVRILAKRTKLATKYVQRSYDSMLKQLKSFTPDGRINEEAHRVVLDLLLKRKRLKKPLPLGKLIDASYFNEALKGM